MEQEQTISLQEIFQILKKRLFLILSITIVALAASAAVSYFVMTPVYKATTTVMAYNTGEQFQEGNSSLSDLQTNLKLINTYNDLIKSDLVLDQVLEELDLDMTTGQLGGKISVSNNKESHVMMISVMDSDPFRAAEIANKTTEILIKEVNNRMNSNIDVITKAKVKENQKPVEPNPKLNIAIAAVIGLMAGAGLAFLLEFLDNTIKTEQDIENSLDLPVIGVIMDINDFMTESEARQSIRQVSSGGEKIGS